MTRKKHKTRFLIGSLKQRFERTDSLVPIAAFDLRVAALHGANSRSHQQMTYESHIWSDIDVSTVLLLMLLISVRHPVRFNGVIVYDRRHNMLKKYFLSDLPQNWCASIRLTCDKLLFKCVSNYVITYERTEAHNIWKVSECFLRSVSHSL